MGGLKDLVLRYAPYWVQDAAIAWYNTRQYRLRHSGKYLEMRAYFKEWEHASRDELAAEARRRLGEFLEHACTHSAWYAACRGKSLAEFPFLEKSQLLGHLADIATVGEKDAVASLTGGTTGASMKVLYTPGDMQERFALLDHFREAHGYRLGERVAWFSGKDLATQKDVERGRCYRDDRRNAIRFFSTFHINQSNFPAYWDALVEFKPRFIVGFPSSVLDLAVFARDRGLRADWKVEAMFPTAETVLSRHREIIGEVFGCRLVDQYASSEGAPFILECQRGRLHMHPLSGVFEVLDEGGNPAREGEMVVTSFTTRGTPLIRYRIGDRMRLADPADSCDCGWQFPLVEWIDGRTNDYLVAQDGERVNLGNLSNCTKEVAGIVCFQVEQRVRDAFLVRVVAGDAFDRAQEERFIANLRQRLGPDVGIDLQRVDSIARERSGKFRLVKNHLAGNGAVTSRDD